MPLSTHFYALEEVQAALFYCGSRYRPEETVFWCREAVDSGCLMETIRTLFESWLWHHGVFDIDGFLHMYRRLSSAEVTEDDLLWCAERLSHRHALKDESLWWILCLDLLDADELFDRVTPRTPPHPPTIDNNTLYFYRAIYQHKASSAWWMASQVSVEQCWLWIMEYVIYVIPSRWRSHYQEWFDALQHYDQLLGFRSEEYDRIMCAVAVLSLSLSKKQRRQSFSVKSMEKRVKVTEDRRAYSVPQECLYGMTRRGRLQREHKGTVEELNDIEKGMKGSSYWEGCRMMYWEDEKETWKSLEQELAFYNMYFPEDLPDEWDASEKEKSHGKGILGKGECPQMSKWISQHFFGQSRLYWLSPSIRMKLQKKIEEWVIAYDDIPIVGWLEEVRRTLPLREMNRSLEPVHKRLVL